MKKLISFFGLFVLASCVWSQVVERKPKQDIRDTISQEQFTKAGLQKLSPSELEALSGALYGWVTINSPQPVVAAQAASPVITKAIPPEVEKKEPVVTARQEQEFGRESVKEKKEKTKKKSDPKEITSSIAGEFKGWNGNTVFRLENGQVWRQADKSKFSVRVKDPEVEIEKGFLGTYFLSIEGYGARCKVKRVH